MALIINIRGTGGSGKSFIVHCLIKKLGSKRSIKRYISGEGYRVGNDGGRVVGYRVGGDVLIVGRYDTDCGGCDQIHTQDEICNRVKAFAEKGKVVIFEGLLISGLYSRYLNLSRELQRKGHQFLWAFLDTSLEKCLKRTVKRRLARGNIKPLNPIHTTNKYRAVELAKEHALHDGEKVITLRSGGAHKQLLKIVKKKLYGRRSTH